MVQPQDLVRLYLHEAERTYSDKLINRDDMDLFQKILRETMRKSFEVRPSPIVSPLLRSRLVRQRRDIRSTTDLFPFRWRHRRWAVHIGHLDG